MIALLLACSAPQDSLTWVEAWEVVILNSDGNLVDLRFVQSNTGIWKGTGYARGDVARRKESTIRLGYDAYPEEVEVLDGGLRLGPDYIEPSADGWQVRFREGNELDGYRDLRMGVLASGMEVPPMEREGWRLEVVDPLAQVSGALVAGGRHRILRGRGVLLHQSGDAPPALQGQRRQAAYALAEDLSIGVEQLGGDVIGWAWIEGELHLGSPILSRDGRDVMLDFQPELPLKVRIAERGPHLEEDPYEELMGVERAAVGVWAGVPTRRLSGGFADIRWKDQTLSAPALTLTVDYE